MSQNPPKYLPFAKPAIDDAAIAEMVACVQSGWLTTGPRVQQFESMLSQYCGGNVTALALTYATAGLQLALQALDLKDGDEVITTALTFVATYNTIVQAGAKPVPVDIDRKTLNMDIGKIESAITPRTRAIVPVHFAGLPVDLDPLYAIAKKHNLRVIEDCAHAIGTEYKGKKLGSFGDIQVFSFHPNKNITTGEGGAVIVRDTAVEKSIKTMRFHGIDRDAFNRFAKSGSLHYDVIAPGYKYNMMDIQAALGIHQLPQLDGFIEKRRHLADRYRKIFAAYPQLQIQCDPGFAHRHAWHLFCALIDPTIFGIDRDTFVTEMKSRDIGIGVHYPATHLYSYYQQQFGFKRGDFPNAEYVGDHIVSLPLFPAMTGSDQDRVIDTMIDVLGIGKTNKKIAGA